MRGGSSKGAYFLASDLPDRPTERDDLLRRIMGSPDPRQIDGIGGAHPLTSKVAVVQPCTDDRADVEYLFLQVAVDTDQVSDRQNCGNILAGVGPFAYERRLCDATVNEATCSIRILMRNSDTVATARFSVADGTPVYEGETAISGVPHTAAAIHLDFEDLDGGSCGAMLPTGNAVDIVNGIECTLIDNGMPVVVLRADALDVTGAETPAELEADESLRSALESIRLAAGPMMNLGDVSDTTVPKMTLVSAPTNGGHLSTRTFIPHRCHEAIGVLGAVSTATAVLLPVGPANDLSVPSTDENVRLEHPTGFFDAAVEIAATDGGGLEVRRAGIVRTARKLMDGIVFPRDAQPRTITPKAVR